MPWIYKLKPKLALVSAAVVVAYEDLEIVADRQLTAADKTAIQTSYDITSERFV